MAFLITREEHVVRFTINRPDIRNAINDDVMQGLEQLISIVQKDTTIQFVVISGAGDTAFCSGGDLSVFHGLKTAEQAYPMLNRMAQVLYHIATLPVPVIALVNGAAVGGGCEIATACDFRIVSSHAKCGFIQGSLAITSGWGGGTYLLEKMPRTDLALRLLSEAKVLRADQLEDMGWTTEVFHGDKEEALRSFLANMKPIEASVHRAYKQMIIRKWTQQNLLGQIEEEVRLCAQLWEADIHHEKVQKFLNRAK